jgi:hypothetical protein
VAPLHFDPIVNVQIVEDLLFVAMVGGDGGGERTLLIRNSPGIKGRAQKQLQGLKYIKR